MTVIQREENVLRIQEALVHYHRERARKGLVRKSQKEIAIDIFQDLKPDTAYQYLSGIKYGRRIGSLEPRYIARICTVTGVSADFLLGLSETVNDKTYEEATI